MRFFAVNRTGVPVHIRLDETDALKTFLLTLSASKVSGGRPLARYVLATTMPLHVSHLDDDAKYVLDNRIGMAYSEGVDRQGDYIFSLDGFVQ
ncbi:MAG TPA: hypothetical protein VLC10_04010 [Patescibacteria group bacterium]|nr:hypothetical protein [Patescibacteria group bacterium]